MTSSPGPTSAASSPEPERVEPAGEPNAVRNPAPFRELALERGHLRPVDERVTVENCFQARPDVPSHALGGEREVDERDDVLVSQRGGRCRLNPLRLRQGRGTLPAVLDEFRVERDVCSGDGVGAVRLGPVGNFLHEPSDIAASCERREIPAASSRVRISKRRRQPPRRAPAARQQASRQPGASAPTPLRAESGETSNCVRENETDAATISVCRVHTRQRARLFHIDRVAMGGSDSAVDTGTASRSRSSRAFGVASRTKRPRGRQQRPALDAARRRRREELWLGLARHLEEALVDDVRDVDEASGRRGRFRVQFVFIPDHGIGTLNGDARQPAPEIRPRQPAHPAIRSVRVGPNVSPRRDDSRQLLHVCSRDSARMSPCPCTRSASEAPMNA